MKALMLSDGSALRYHDLAGQGPPILFVHGLGCAGSCDYPAVARAPSLVDRRVVLVDLLGYGHSDRPAEFGYTVADHARAPSPPQRRATSATGTTDNAPKAKWTSRS